MRSFAFLIGLFLLFAIGVGMATGLPAESGGRLLVGWLFFLGHASSRITVNWSGVATLAVPTAPRIGAAADESPTTGRFASKAATAND